MQAIAFAMLGIIALFALIGSASALSPMKESDTQPAEEWVQVETKVEQVLYADFGVWISDMDENGYVDYHDFKLWAFKNPGEYACGDIRRSARGFNPMRPLSPFVRNQIESLRLVPGIFDNGEGASCWGYNSRNELIVARSYTTGNLALTGHWESDGNGGTGLLRRWLASPIDNYATGTSFRYMSRYQEGAIYSWISGYGTHYKFVECDNSRYLGFERCSYEQLDWGDEPTGVTVTTYTRNGFLYQTKITTLDQGLVAIFSMEVNDDTMIRRNRDLCPFSLTRYDRWGYETDSTVVLCPTVPPISGPPPPDPEDQG